MIDIIVAGGGPSGLAVATRAVQAGLEVVLVEPRSGVIDKACGEGLMPGALAALDDLGISNLSGYPFRGIRYLDGTRVAEADFPARSGLGVRRTTLHDALRAAARDAGVRVVQGKVEAFEQTDTEVRAGGFSARYLIGSDGLRSTVRAQLGLECASGLPPRYGVRRHFAVPPWSDRVEVWWSALAEAYVTPVTEQMVGVALLFDDRARSAARGPGALFERMLDEFPELRERLTHPCSAVRGAGPFAVRCKKTVAGRVLLTGDAAGYVDPLTGEGLKLAFGAAEAAVAAILADRPADYDAAWWRLTRRYRWLTRALLSASRRPRCRRWVVPGAARVPGLMGAVVGALAE